MGQITRLASIWAAAFAVRLLYVVQSQQSPFYDFPLVDAKTYVQAATAMALGHWSGDGQPFWQPPLYPHFLGVLFAFFEPDFTLPRLVQAALGATICLLIYWLGRQVFSAKVAWCSAGLAVFYGPFIFFEGELLPPVVAILLNLSALLALLWAIEGQLRRLLLPGLLLGLSALCVANILLFVPVAAGWIFHTCRDLPMRQRLLRPAVMLLGVVLTVAPVSLRNYIVGDDLVLISSNAGLNFYIGNNPHYHETVAIQPGPAWLDLTSRPHVEAGAKKPSAQSHFFLAQSWDFIRNQPAAFLQLQLYKLYLFWNGDEIGRNQALYFARQYSSVLQILLWKYGLAFPFGLLAPLALTGIALGWRGRILHRPRILLLGLFTATYILSVVAFFISARYRLPVIPPLLLFASYGGWELYELWRQRAYNGLIAGCSITVACLVACNWGVGTMDMDGDAQTHYRLGYVYEKKGLPINAIIAYHKALELDPDIKWARFNLASQYARRGEYGRAIAVYRDFIRRFPDVERAHLALGNVYLQTRRFPEAINQYRSLLAVPGTDTADIQGRLGYAYTQAGRVEEAVKAYGALIAIKPDSLQARFQWGQLHETLEHPDIARSEYEKILAADPSRTAVRHRLARLLFFADEPQKARTHLEQAIALDPQAIDTRLLLATQYIVERRVGDAMEQVQAILAMQPEHQQANRLVGHLYMVKGDTTKGIEYLDRFTEYYREERSTELFKQIKEQWDGKLQGPQR